MSFERLHESYNSNKILIVNLAFHTGNIRHSLTKQPALFSVNIYKNVLNLFLEEITLQFHCYRMF